MRLHRIELIVYSTHDAKSSKHSIMKNCYKSVEEAIERRKLQIMRTRSLLNKTKFNSPFKDLKTLLSNDKNQVFQNYLTRLTETKTTEYSL